MASVVKSGNSRQVEHRMSQAQLKNEVALRQMVGVEALAERLQVRIGIFSDEQVGVSGLLMAEALGEVFGRLWRNIDVWGGVSERFLASATQAARSGNQIFQFQQAWNPPYDYVISIGCAVPLGTNRGIRVGASGWTAKFGSDAIITADPNPVGPAAAAALTGIEVFKRVFEVELGSKLRFMPDDYEWSAGNYGTQGENPPAGELNLDDLHLFGVGAVSHGLLWVLERWPYGVRGSIHLIDQDRYDESNAQRYVGMQASDQGAFKASRAATRLQEKLVHLQAHGHCIDMNTYYECERPDCCVRLSVIGVDSAEHRRQLALKLPLRVVNMWTEKERLGVARFGFTDGWACPFCAYPAPKTDLLDETGQIHRETGLHPARVRQLLFSGGGLTVEDVSILKGRYQLTNIESLIGKPLRSIRGVLCATGRISLPNQPVDVDVPFVFSSFLAGICGFSELVHELEGTLPTPGHWQFSLLNYPVAGNWYHRAPVADCYLCSDSAVADVLNTKYKNQV